MKLKLETTRKEVTEVDVEFPIYRQHDVGGDNHESVIYARIEFKEQGLMGPLVTQYSVQRSRSYIGGSESFEMEIQTVLLDGRSGADYTLGRGEYACTREEFDEVAAKAEAFLRRVRSGEG